MEHVWSGIFGMMHIQPVLGRGFLPSDDKAGTPPVVMLGYGIWKERDSSSPSMLGRQVRVNEKLATIVGIMPKGFKFPTNIDMWTPLVPGQSSRRARTGLWRSLECSSRRRASSRQTWI